MKIAFLSWSFFPLIGGAQIFSLNLIKNLIKKGHQVDIYLPSQPYEDVKKLENLNLNFIRISNFESFQLKYYDKYLKNKFLKFQKQNCYDIWQVVGSYPPGYLLSELRSLVPVILRTHGEDIQENSVLNYGSGLNPRINKKIHESLNNSKKLIALTNDVKTIYLKKKVPENKIEIIPNGIDLNLFKTKNFNELDRSKKIKLLSVGRNHKKKGYDLIPETIAKLNENNIEFEWTIIGKNLKDLDFLSNTNLHNQLNIIDEISPEIKENYNSPSSKLINKYKEADIFIMTSYLETFGMVLIEAMASGLYIISSNSEGCRNVIEDYKNGILFEKGNTTDLVKKIMELIDNKKLQNEIYSNLTKSVKKYDWDNISNKYIKIYEDEITNFLPKK